MRATILPLLLLLPATSALAENNPLHLSASVNASTSTVINGIVFNRPQFSGNLDGWHGHTSFGVNIASAYSGNNNGTDHQDRYFVAYEQRLKPVTLKYQVTYKNYPGTRAGLTDHGVTYGVTASHGFKGLSVGLGVDYTDTDYTTIRKSYGLNLSLGHSFGKLSSWLSVSHHHQFGSVDYTNTNMGVYYPLSPKMGMSASINNWHAYADWNHDRPTLSLSLSRRL